jgi:hypothetical protein
MRWRRWGMRRGWYGGGWGGPGPMGGWGRMGGWGWRRRGWGCFPCCSMLLVLPVLGFLALAVTFAVHYI